MQPSTTTPSVVSQFQTFSIPTTITSTSTTTATSSPTKLLPSSTINNIRHQHPINSSTIRHNNKMIIPFSRPTSTVSLDTAAAGGEKTNNNNNNTNCENKVDPSVVVTMSHPYNSTTLFQTIKKREFGSISIMTPLPDTRTSSSLAALAAAAATAAAAHNADADRAAVGAVVVGVSTTSMPMTDGTCSSVEASSSPSSSSANGTAGQTVPKPTIRNEVVSSTVTTTSSSSSSSTEPQQQQQQQQPPLKKRRTLLVQTTTAAISQKMVTSKNTNIVIRPSDYAKSAFRANGSIVSNVQNQYCQRYFRNDDVIGPTQEMVDAYTPQLLDIVRRNDLVGLKSVHTTNNDTTGQQQHQRLDGCNRYGESLLHLACRKGHTGIVKYLLTEGKVSIHIRDDYNRTPLHDACWTVEPNFELVDIMIQLAPEQVLMEDVRGYTPLDYVRKEHWGKWLRFLWERKSILKPTTTKSTKIVDGRDDVPPP